MHPIYTLDLNFLGRSEAIAAYLIPHQHGAVLVETGAGSTSTRLKEALNQHNYSPEDITHVFITHIHLDHAGASGWLANKGAEILVHPVGEPHMRDPNKLLTSAKRLYQDQMDTLWGEFLPVPQNKLIAVADREETSIGELKITAIHTPGHAEHHISWLLEDTCFTGDVGGIRIPGEFYIRLPLVPPELHFKKWKHSLNLLKSIGFTRIAPTHFGVYDDSQRHLDLALQVLEENEEWMESNFVDERSIEELRQEYTKFLFQQGVRLGVDEETLKTSEIANPSWITADGMQRYWNKFRRNSE